MADRAGMRRRPELPQGSLSRLSGASGRDAFLISLQAVFRRRARALPADHSGGHAPAAARAGGHRKDGARRVLPHQLGPDALRARARSTRAGQGLGGGLDRGLRPRHHACGSDRAQPAFRALPARGDDQHPRHRHRLLHRASRAGDPVRLREVRLGANRDGLQRRHVPAADGDQAGRQGARLFQRAAGPAGQGCRPLVHRGRRGRGFGNGAAARHAAAKLAAVPGALPRGDRVSTPSLHPQRGDARDRRAARGHRPGGAGGDGGPAGRAVQQGRCRGPGADQDGHARAADAVSRRRGARAHQGPQRCAPRPRPAASQRPGRVRHVQRGGHDRCVPDRVARADADAASHAARVVQRPGRGGGDHPPGADPGQRRPSLHQAQAGSRAGHVCPPAPGADSSGHDGGDPLPGTDHRDRHVRRGYEAQRGRWVPTSDDQASEPG